MDQYEVPKDLDQSGNELWCGVSAGRTLTAAHLALLHNICRIADRCDALIAELGPNLTTTNHRGDTVINPLIAEHRQQLATMNQLLSRMGLVDLPKGKSTTKASVKDQLAAKREARRA